jgi:hypothetical protein
MNSKSTTPRHINKGEKVREWEAVTGIHEFWESIYIKSQHQRPWAMEEITYSLEAQRNMCPLS